MDNQKPENMETDINSDRLRRSALPFLRKAGLLFAFFFALYAVGILLMSVLSIDGLRKAQLGLHSFGEWWVVARVAFIAGLIVWWTPVNTWFARRNGWSGAHLSRVLAGRWLTLGVLAFVELFLIQRIHEPFTDRWFQ